MADKIILDGNSLTLETIENFVNKNFSIELDSKSIEKVNTSRALIEKWIAEDKVIYGVTTGFGEFANIKISANEIKKLQENLILSHAVGCGDQMHPRFVKIMMLLRLNALVKGYSGIRLETLNVLLKMIENNIIPFVPMQGSVGSSGDLVPLSHLVLAMIGKGKVQILSNVNDDSYIHIDLINSAEGLAKFNLKPVVLEAKEGLALINGTQMMTSFASYISARAKKMIKIADMSAALTHEALKATDKAYDPKLHQLRPFKGQIDTAANMLKLIEGSEIRKSHVENDKRVQDAYSIRCVPQIHGASRDAIEYVCSRVSIEINSVNDNPIIFTETEEHIEGGNFHGQSMALAMDFMAIALSELANVSERRIERMVNGSLSGLPRFLAYNGGLNSGFMIAQYTAASLVSENKVLAHPASVDSIPTSANQEDHNSMGSIAAQKCFKVLQNLENVLAIELTTAAQALEFLKPLKCGKGTDIIYSTLRKYIKPVLEDRFIYEDIKKTASLIKNDILLDQVEKEIPLN